MTFKQFIKEDQMWHGDRNNVFIGTLSLDDQAKVKVSWQLAKLHFKKSSRQPDSYDFSTTDELKKVEELVRQFKA